MISIWQDRIKIDRMVQICIQTHDYSTGFHTLYFGDCDYGDRHNCCFHVKDIRGCHSTKRNPMIVKTQRHWRHWQVILHLWDHQRPPLFTRHAQWKIPFLSCSIPKKSLYLLLTHSTSGLKWPSRWLFLLYIRGPVMEPHALEKICEWKTITNLKMCLVPNRTSSKHEADVGIF